MIRLLRDYPLYQLKVTLTDSKPAIWRRFQVKKETTLLKLHQILQIVMGWDDTHLHEFRIGDLRFGEPVPEEDYDVIDERNVSLSQFAPSDPITLEYLYDFGDGWEHEVFIEQGVDKKPGVRYPVCIEGARACPPEDVGAITGYEDFLKVIRNRRHPEHEDMLAWIGGHFDPEAFDLKAVNRLLLRIK
ncbi:MAG TPA: plasmid pRiA4b ORF-3 family protein [Blastocatellia bacterium]|nr:plasmid pRiA4b ORF-3 family protein [Blastocatellia bacterium]